MSFSLVLIKGEIEHSNYCFEILYLISVLIGVTTYNDNEVSNLVYLLAFRYHSIEFVLTFYKVFSSQ